MNADKPRNTQYAIRHMVGLIGWPVEHSVSPAMHNAAFAALGLDGSTDLAEVWRYELLPTPPGQVAATLTRLRVEGFAGANVTVPHKEAVIPYLDDLTDDARTVGAVNTIFWRDGALVGDTTDADGFLLALSRARFALLGVRVLVVGAGGAARAVVYGLLKFPSVKVWLLNRSVERAEVLARDLDRREGQRSHLPVLPLTAETLLESAYDADLLVNATPLGMWPHVDASIWPEGVPIPEHLTVFDLVYNPLETRLLQQARASRAKAIGGLEMLVQQGALAFWAWTGRRAPLDVMRSAARARLVQS
jgi:shikimate dehydrogenase